MSPAGNVHFAAWRMGLVPVIVAITITSGVIATWLYRDLGMYYAFYAVEWWFWVIFWYWMGRYCDPDTDLIGVTQADGRLIRELWILGDILFAYLTLYSALVNRLARFLKVKGIAGAHRSWLTHSPIGTALRLAVIDLPLGWTFQFFTREDVTVFFFAQLIGLGVADGIHVLMDIYYKE